MSAGGGDQYGSFNMPVEEDGIIKVIVDGEEKHARTVKKNDPVLLMSNDKQAITDWVSQVFRDASKNDKEVYFGLKREYMEYDEVFSTAITDVRHALAKSGTRPTVLYDYAAVQPAEENDYRSTAQWALPGAKPGRRYFSDISAALGGSLATASSIIESKEGTMLYEAPHGTAHDLYLKYLESDGKEAIFNSSALIYALANALETMALREDNQALIAYSNSVERSADRYRGPGQNHR